MAQPPPSGSVSGSVSRIVGRYALFDAVASGGMATVHLGRLLGSVGFSRTVAIKRLHPHLASNEDFVNMLVDEARLAARIQHPNVIPTLDVVHDGSELLIVMEYVHGESLSHIRKFLARNQGRVPVEVACSVMAGALYGLHAAHTATSENGVPLAIVHRDVSPQNILLGRDGVPRVFDFGVAKAAVRVQSTRTGTFKGKLQYAAPEQFAGRAEQRSDVYAAAIVLWEMLTGVRMFKAEDDTQLITQILQGCSVRPSELRPDIPPEVDEIVMKGLALAPEHRWETAKDMAMALEHAVRPVTARQLAEWLQGIAGERLSSRAARVAEIESSSSLLGPIPVDMPSGVQRNPGAHGESTSSGVNSTARAVTDPSRSAVLQAPPPPSLSRWVPLLLAGVLVGALGLLAGVVLMTRGGPPRVDPPAAARPPPPIAAPRIPNPPPAPTDALPAAPQVEIAADTGTPTAPSRPAATSAPARPKPGAPGAAPAPAAPAPVKPAAEAKPADCSPPYTLDSDGNKRFKPQCL